MEDFYFQPFYQGLLLIFPLRMVGSATSGVTSGAPQGMKKWDPPALLAGDL
jgi:hypothetical protein